MTEECAVNRSKLKVNIVPIAVTAFIILKKHCNVYKQRNLFSTSAVLRNNAHFDNWMSETLFTWIHFTPISTLPVYKSERENNVIFVICSNLVFQNKWNCDSLIFLLVSTGNRLQCRNWPSCVAHTDRARFDKTNKTVNG